VMNERIGGEGMMMMTTKKRDYTHRWRARSSPARTTDSNPTRYTQVSGSSTQSKCSVCIYTKAAVTDSHKHIQTKYRHNVDSKKERNVYRTCSLYKIKGTQRENKKVKNLAAKNDWIKFNCYVLGRRLEAYTQENW
jgi:hypothetical protein